MSTGPSTVSTVSVNPAFMQQEEVVGLHHLPVVLVYRLSSDVHQEVDLYGVLLVPWQLATLR